jgi:hypothetical protein
MNRSTVDALPAVQFFLCVLLLTACAPQQLPASKCPQAPTVSGVESRGAVVNMKEIAEQEARNPPPPRPPKVVHEPMPRPGKGGEVPEAEGRPCPPLTK